MKIKKGDLEVEEGGRWEKEGDYEGETSCIMNTYLLSKMKTNFIN